ncbi:hypothetical protein [Rossellomorea aquimaris]|jgi:hypothetical protein|nr:hypothetical protein [Rossellomorea aquimaris]
MSKKPIKKVNVFLAVFLTVITGGTYLAFWFINRKKEINNITSEDKIPYKWWIVCAIYLILSLVINFIGGAFLTPYGETTIESINLILSYYFLGLLYYSAFRTKEVIEMNSQDVEIKPVLLVLFHVWYLQFKINKIEEFGRG